MEFRLSQTLKWMPQHSEVNFSWCLGFTLKPTRYLLSLGAGLSIYLLIHLFMYLFIYFVKVNKVLQCSLVCSTEYCDLFS